MIERIELEMLQSKINLLSKKKKEEADRLLRNIQRFDKEICELEAWISNEKSKESNSKTESPKAPIDLAEDLKSLHPEWTFRECFHEACKQSSPPVYEELEKNDKKYHMFRAECWRRMARVYFICEEESKAYDLLLKAASIDAWTYVLDDLTLMFKPELCENGIPSKVEFADSRKHRSL